MKDWCVNSLGYVYAHIFDHLYVNLYESLLHNSDFLVLSFVIINYSSIFAVALAFHAAITHAESDLTDS